jgi:hypothetical protein
MLIVRAVEVIAYISFYISFHLQINLLRSCLPQGIFVKGYEDRMVSVGCNISLLFRIQMAQHLLLLSDEIVLYVLSQYRLRLKPPGV